eukprot:g43683.t1
MVALTLAECRRPLTFFLQHFLQWAETALIWLGAYTVDPEEIPTLYHALQLPAQTEWNETEFTVYSSESIDNLDGLFVTGSLGLQGPQAENEVVFFQLALTFTGTQQQARDRDVGQGTG